MYDAIFCEICDCAMIEDCPEGLWGLDICPPIDVNLGRQIPPLLEAGSLS